MAMRIILDRSLCDGNGSCMAEAPLHFMLDENDELRLLNESVETGDLAAVQRAIQGCPKAALQLLDVAPSIEI
jgi:ferredoxin